MSWKKEVVSIRGLESIDYAIAVKWTFSPSWLDRLLGKKPTTQQGVYVGNVVWRDAVTGARVGLALEDWLDEQLNAHRAREMYRRDVDKTS